MADIRINQLPAGGGPVATDFIPLDNGSTRKATVQDVVEIGRPAASQAEAEAGTNPTKVMTPLTTKQAVTSYGLLKENNLNDVASASSARTNLGLAIGSDVQAYDAALASIAGLTTAADQMIYTTASDAYATTALTAFARTILDDADAAAVRSTLVLGNSATLNIGTTAGTVAAGDDTRVVNAVQQNVDSGITRTSTASSISFETGSFGGSFLDAKASTVFQLDKNVVDATTGPRFTVAITHEFVGGHGNGPDNARAGLWIYVGKKDRLTTNETGEGDAAYFLIEAGNKDDAGGLLIHGSKVFGAGTTGGLTAIELVAQRQNTSGVVTNAVRAVVGFQEAAGGATNAGGSGIYLEAEAGSVDSAIHVVNNATGVFSAALRVLLSRNPASRNFELGSDGTNTIARFGSSTDQVQLVYIQADDAFYIRNTAGSTNLASLNQSGELSVFAGVRVASGGALLKRVLTNTASLNVASTPSLTSSATLTMTVTGALVGDSVVIDVISNTLAGAQFNYLAEVTAADTVTIYPFNMSSATADPPAQTFRATVFGF